MVFGSSSSAMPPRCRAGAVAVAGGGLGRFDGAAVAAATARSSQGWSQAPLMTPDSDAGKVAAVRRVELPPPVLCPQCSAALPLTSARGRGCRGAPHLSAARPTSEKARENNRSCPREPETGRSNARVSVGVRLEFRSSSWREALACFFSLSTSSSTRPARRVSVQASCSVRQGYLWAGTGYVPKMTRDDLIASISPNHAEGNSAC